MTAKRIKTPNTTPETPKFTSHDIDLIEREKINPSELNIRVQAHFVSNLCDINNLEEINRIFKQIHKILEEINKSYKHVDDNSEIITLILTELENRRMLGISKNRRFSICALYFLKLYILARKKLEKRNRLTYKDTAREIGAQLLSLENLAEKVFLIINNTLSEKKAKVSNSEILQLDLADASLHSEIARHHFDVEEYLIRDKQRSAGKAKKAKDNKEHEIIMERAKHYLNNGLMHSTKNEFYSPEKIKAINNKKTIVRELQWNLCIDPEILKLPRFKRRKKKFIKEAIDKKENSLKKLI